MISSYSQTFLTMVLEQNASPPPTKLRKFFTKPGPSLVIIKHENCFFFTEQNCFVLNLGNLNIFIEKGSFKTNW